MLGTLAADDVHSVYFFADKRPERPVNMGAAD